MIKLCPKPIFLVLIMLISFTKSSSKSQYYLAHDHHGDEYPILDLYMHDVLGGNSPTARPVTGLLGAIYSGHVPFSKPTPARPSNGVVAGGQLAGTTPLFRAQSGADGLSLGFGTVVAIDDALTAGPGAGSRALGRARGVYVATGIGAAWSVMVAFTAVMEGGEYGDSLSLCGVYLGGSQTTSRLGVVGGTGRFRSVGGFAEVRSLVPPDGQRPETLLRIKVHLRYI